jgi:hypothetical protein
MIGGYSISSVAISDDQPISFKDGDIEVFLFILNINTDYDFILKLSY